ncbi:MAG: hypothetical protein HYR84_06065 [Planctomycetes bacterium]|nr:hypothetical protein [Planctomycetota bacterium]
MTLLYCGFLLALVGVSVGLILLALRLSKSEAADESYSTPARFFLIAVRLAIGWHCLVEGLDKISMPNWSGETYLRESIGPLSGLYRAIPGDRLVDKATLGPDDAFPAELGRDWQIYFDAFVAHYELTAEQRERAKGILDQRKSDTQSFLKSKTETVTKIAPYPPELKVEMTMKQRLDELERLAKRARDAEAKFPTTAKDVHTEWRVAKADLARWRADIKKTIDAQTDKLKTMDPAFKEKTKKAIEDLTGKWKGAKNQAEAEKLKKQLDEETDKLWEPLADVLTSEQKQMPPLPASVPVPISQWRLLELSDFLVKWSLVVLGGCLMLGLLSRTSSLLTALLLLSFYLAMPALPGWPESPRLEGHYVLVNKTLIEVIALLALTFIPTGRWAGLDGLLCLCCGRSPAPDNDAKTV